MKSLFSILIILFWQPLVVPKDSVKVKAAPESLKKLFNQVVNQSKKSKEPEIEIDGLLVDDTKTKTGKDFYDLFFTNWVAPAGARNYTITIAETFSAYLYTDCSVDQRYSSISVYPSTPAGYC